MVAITVVTVTMLFVVDIAINVLSGGPEYVNDAIDIIVVGSLLAISVGLSLLW